MKVVLFCGGYGMRMRGWNGEGLPKPLQLVGDLPLVVHVMGHYARFGHKDFVLCLGYAADQVRAAVAEAVAHDYTLWSLPGSVEGAARSGLTLYLGSVFSGRSGSSSQTSRCSLRTTPTCSATSPSTPWSPG